MTVMTLSEAVFERLALRRNEKIKREQEKKREAREKAALVALLEVELRTWFIAELGIEIPEEVSLVITQQWGNKEAPCVRFVLRLRGFEDSYWVTLANNAWLEFWSDKGFSNVGPLRWLAKNTGPHVQHENFIDAVIFALGGERDLRDMGVIRCVPSTSWSITTSTTPA